MKPCVKFLIVSNVEHIYQDEKYWGYGPYIREMNLWENNIDKLIVVAPLKIGKAGAIDLAYSSANLDFRVVPAFNVKGIKNKILALINIPFIFWQVFKAMQSADHIHLRCPGNMGLIGSIVQILFPKKNKSAKYAGNWDPKMKKIRSYNWQRAILSNTFLTRNMKVLVYGEWPNQSRNIIPFFTASYKKYEIISTPPRELNGKIKCVYCGYLTNEKRPLQSIKVVEELYKMGIDIELTILGNGKEYRNLQTYIDNKGIGGFVHLLGNVEPGKVKSYMQESHFLTFYGHDSEGWPKVVAESMFWGCVPLVRSISCTRFMLGNGLRGTIVEDNIESMKSAILKYLSNIKLYQATAENAMSWSRTFTLEKFEQEIKSFL